MGIGGIGIWQLLIILVIVLLLFGTKRLKGLGGDLGGAIKGFKKAMTEEKAPEGEQEPEKVCLLYTSPSPRDLSTSRMPSSA